MILDMDDEKRPRMIFDLKQIKKHIFENTEEPALAQTRRAGDVYRLTAGDRWDMPPDNTDISKLRIRLSELFDSKLGSYERLETACDIKRDTFQKVMRFKNGRNVTYQFLAKFAVGARLSVEEARELFEQMGSPLNPHKNRYDYILLCELKNGSTIVEFNEDLVSLGYHDIFSKAD